jgi:MoaA/NifB/PqqE/SkfB family radical SAM enzyme
MDFPQFISFTVTNSCNLRCRMCGQWSDEGYVRNHKVPVRPRMELEDWIRLVDEVSHHKIRFILVRGGEPFLFPGIMDLLRYISSKGIFLSIDTNGTVLERFAEELARIDRMHITFSVDGPEHVHDHVRGAQGAFAKLRDNVALLREWESRHNNSISKSICFTISNDNYASLGSMADVARSLSMTSVNIVPYYYYPDAVGLAYEDLLQDYFHCTAFSWRGFHRETAGVEFERFRQELRAYLASLDGIENFPYMPFTEEEYRIWFTDQVTPVGSSTCGNVERLIDVQPNGKVNFCVDLPDYSFGNVKGSTIEEVWSSPEAERFRAYRREKPLSVCYRCGARYISEIKE